VRVLGPVDVVGPDGPLRLSTSVRTVLAALAVDAGRVVSAATLTDRLWPDADGDVPASTLQSYVSRLRRLLEPAPAGRDWSVLVTRAPGYLLRLAPGALDAGEFHRLLRAARAEPDPALARTHVGAALALWRGSAYADVAAPFAQEEADRLAEARLQAAELAAELDLALGRHREVVDELAALVRAEPLREGLRASLMLALYRSSRQGEALEVFTRTRELR
jgi:DNA-binding SARP family transcriptional activator